MKNLDNLLKICGIVLLITLTVKVMTYDNGRYYFSKEDGYVFDTRSGIVTLESKDNTVLYPMRQINVPKGEQRYFLDEKWGKWEKRKNNKID